MARLYVPDIEGSDDGNSVPGTVVYGNKHSILWQLSEVHTVITSIL